MIKLDVPGKLSLPTEKTITKSIKEILEDLARDFQAEVQKNILEKEIIDRGVLLKSIKILRPDNLERDVVSTVTHAPYLEFGRAKGKFPPIEPLKEWVIRKGLYEGTTPTTKPELVKVRKILRADRGQKAKSIAYAIAKSIEKRGQKARPFFRPAIKIIERKVKKMKIGEKLLNG